MKRVISYLKSEGLLTFLKKVVSIIYLKIGISNSITLFFRCDKICSMEERMDLVIKKLSYENLKQFEKMKFFGHIQGVDYINNPNQLILLAFNGDNIVGYISAQYGIKREIFGLGSFSLDDNECWIGPVYVIREYRCQGISSYLIKYIQNRMYTQKEYYTCINETNHSSIASFKKLKFQEIGSVSSHKKDFSIIRDDYNLISEHFISK